MSSVTIEITPEAHRSLQALADSTGEQVPAVLDRAVEAYRRRMFLEGLADDFDALRRDDTAWAEELAERAEWDAVSADVPDQN